MPSEIGIYAVSALLAILVGPALERWQHAAYEGVFNRDIINLQDTDMEIPLPISFEGAL